MTKEQAIALAGSQAKLAALLKINSAAISQWAAIPERRIWQLKVLRPKWFKK
jgi:DNA-binding transcriptional regulator YdaS (Cro superfamily)